MNKYTIYCTEAQTKRALELGAPIELKKHTYFDYSSTPYSYEDGEICPTAEQMIGWLEECMDFIISIDILVDTWRFDIYKSNSFIKGHSAYDTRKSATLAAIDAVLEYLSNNKK